MTNFDAQLAELKRLAEENMFSASYIAAGKPDSPKRTDENAIPLMAILAGKKLNSDIKAGTVSLKRLNPFIRTDLIAALRMAFLVKQVPAEDHIELKGLLAKLRGKKKRRDDDDG